MVMYCMAWQGGVNAALGNVVSLYGDVLCVESVC